MRDFLDELNESQRAAVEYCDGSSLVIAGAGSGKTRVLTYKVAHLLQQGMKPWSIMALTFTNKAAKEMKERIGQLVSPEQARGIYMGTFHSIFGRILRREAHHIGYTQNFTIYDSNDSRSLVKVIVKELKLNDKQYKPASVLSRISKAKNDLVTPQQYAANHAALEADRRAQMPEIWKIYVEYDARCRRSNVMDFDDMLLNTFMLYRDHKDVLQRYAEQFEYILVDEYQDTNAVQQKIVSQLASVHHRVCAVGDDAQSIYAFRGANIDNILGFMDEFQGARQFKLEQNYRSTQTIVEAANSLIRHNRRQIPKQVYSMGGEGDRISVKQAYSDKEEATIVCRDISTMMRRDKDATYSDFAILYRTNAQSRTFEEEFRRVGMPYKIFGAMSFYQRKEIKDIMAYFRLVVNPSDEEALKRVINYPARGIGNTTLAKVATAAAQGGVGMWDVLTAPDRYALAVSRATMAKLAAFRLLISSFAQRQDTDDAYTLAHDIVKLSGIAADVAADTSPEGMARQENVDEFMSSIQEFVDNRREDAELTNRYSLTDFIHEVSLITDLESSDDDDHETAHVNLMTVHSAKGLEFPYVFVVGLEEDIFPSAMSMDSMRELEEERRLLYVAITRAGKWCELTCARSRYRYGQQEFHAPSMFIRDITPQLLAIEGLGGAGGDYGRGRAQSQYGQQNSHPVASQFRADPKPRAVGHVDDTYHFRKPSASGMRPAAPNVRQTARPMSSAPSVRPAAPPSGYVAVGRTSAASSATPAPSSPSAQQPLSEGMVIEHSRFGIGTVVRVEGQGENTKATVDFRNAGTKQLLVKFARFKVVG